MSELQLSSKLKYQELLVDSSQTQRSEDSSYTALNWPRLSYEDRLLNPAGIKVIAAEIPVVFDTLLEESNRFLVTVQQLGFPVQFPVYITPGNYNVDELIQEMLNALNSISTGWTITWSDLTQKFTFQHTDVFTFDFRPIGTLQTLMYKFMGFEKNSVNFSSGNTLTSSRVANPSGPYYLYLNSRNLGQEVNALVQNNDDNTPSLQICRIPIDVQRGAFIFYRDPTPQNYFDFTPGFKFQNIDLFLTIESAYGYQVVDLKGLSFSVKIALLTYREGGSNHLARPSNSFFAGA